MNVKLIAHTQLSEDFRFSLPAYANCGHTCEYTGCVCNDPSETDGQVTSLVAIRTCYSHLKPSEIVAVEGDKYFGKSAADGGTGTDADRLFRQIVKSGHTSTLEHLTFTFAIEGVSRALLAQLTRHRVGFSFSVQSQRYVKFGSGDKSGGFDYVVPESISSKTDKVYVLNGREVSMAESFTYFMDTIQRWYDFMRENGVPAEDARMILPNAAATNLTMTANLRALLDFYAKRRRGRGAQWEIAELAERLRKCVVAVEPWTDQFFEIA